MKEITLVGGRGDGRRVKWERSDPVRFAVPSQDHGWSGDIVTYRYERYYFPICLPGAALLCQISDCKVFCERDYTRDDDSSDDYLVVTVWATEERHEKLKYLLDPHGRLNRAVRARDHVLTWYPEDWRARIAAYRMCEEALREVVSFMLPGKKREDNPRLVDRQSWWIAFGQWQIGETSGPICTECADPMPGAGLVGGEVCDECLPYVVGEQL